MPPDLAYLGLPTDGDIDAFDSTRARQEQPGRCASSEVAGDAVRVTGPDGSVTTLLIEDGGARLHLGQVTLRRVAPADVVRLDGSYAGSIFVDTSSPLTGPGGVASEQRIDFAADGSFSSRSLTGTSSDAGATSETVSGSGRYSLGGNTLLLAFDSGSEGRSTFFVHPESEGQVPPRLLVIDGQIFRLRDQQ